MPNVIYNRKKVTECVKHIGVRRTAMNVRMLKAKRVEQNLRQKDLAKALGITEKAMRHKECSSENKFKAQEMLTLVKQLNLSFSEFDAIFLIMYLPNV